MAEGAPLLREYRVKSSIEGSNPSHSASSKKPLSGLFCCLKFGARDCVLCGFVRIVQSDVLLRWNGGVACAYDLRGATAA